MYKFLYKNFYSLLLALAILCIIIPIMLTPWGSLPKAQDDPQLITEAITAAIAAHESDPTAHLGDGESLEQHKTNEVIDHPAFSVVRDKIEFDRYQFDDPFFTLDAWSIGSGVSLTAPSEMEIMTTATSGNTRTAYLGASGNTPAQASISQNPHWITRFLLSQITNQTIYITQGAGGLNDSFGFKIVNNTLSAFYRQSSGAEVLHTISGFTLTDFHNYEVRVKNGADIEWWVDGVLQHSVSGLTIANADVFIFYSLKTDANALKSMYVQSLHFDADYS